MPYIHFKKERYQDLTRGIDTVRVLMTTVPQKAFMEMTRIFLRHRLVRINKRLFHAYRKLGEQGLRSLEEAASDKISAPSQLERERICKEIETLLNDQKQIVTEIEQTIEEAKDAE